MPRLSRSKHYPRTGSLTARKRRSRVPRTGYLANPAGLIGIPKLQVGHAGDRIAFGCSDLNSLAQALVEKMPIVSADVQLDGYGVTRIW